MIPHREVLVPALLAGFTAIVLLIPGTSVGARTIGDSASLSRHTFDERSFLSERELAEFPPGLMEGPQGAALPEGKGKDLTLLKCNKCHASRVWDKKHYTEEKWSAIMDQMVEKGMEASDEEIATMTSYLTENFGPEKKDPPPPPVSPR